MTRCKVTLHYFTLYISHCIMGQMKLNFDVNMSATDYRSLKFTNLPYMFPKHTSTKLVQNVLYKPFR